MVDTNLEGQGRPGQTAVEDKAELPKGRAIHPFPGGAGVVAGRATRTGPATWPSPGAGPWPSCPDIWLPRQTSRTFFPDQEVSAWGCHLIIELSLFTS